MSFTSITATHRFQNLDGTAGSGVVVFRLDRRITNGGTSLEPTVPLHVTLDGSGNMSQALPANDDPSTVPAGSSYIVEIILNGASADTYSGVVIPSAAPGGTVDLGTLLPSQVGA